MLNEPVIEVALPLNATFWAIIWRETKIDKKTSPQQKFNLLTSINVDIECCNDGNVLIAQEISDAVQAKISLGLLTS
jgi:hypothetical protein